MPTQKPRITDPRFLIIPETRKTDGRTLDCTGFPEKRIAKRSCSWYNPQCARSNIGMSPSGKAPDFDSGIRRFKSGHPSQHDPLAQLAEQLPFKQWVRGSNPRRVTNSSQASYRLRRVFYTPHQKLIGLILLLLLSNRNSFRWIRGWLCPEGSSIYTAVTSQ